MDRDHCPWLEKHKVSLEAMSLLDFRTVLQYSLSVGKSFVCLVHSQEDAGKMDQASALIKQTVLGLIPAGDDTRSYEVIVLHSCDVDIPSVRQDAMQVIILPNFAKMTRGQQYGLVHAMKAAVDSGKHIFIGLVPYSDGIKIPSGNSSANTEHILKEIIPTEAWLRNRFWLACTAPSNSITNQERLRLISTTAIDKVNMQSSIRRYITDIMVHLRMHRLAYKGKGGGVHSNSINDMVTLSKLISISSTASANPFVTPKHVKLASAYYFPLHFQLVRNTSMDTSILYGSKPYVVNEFLRTLAIVRDEMSTSNDNPLLIESLVVSDVLKKVIPPA